MSSPTKGDAPENHCTTPKKPEVKNMGYKLVKTTDGTLWPIVNLEELFVSDPSKVIQQWATDHKIKPVAPKKPSFRSSVRFGRELRVFECW